MTIHGNMNVKFIQHVFERTVQNRYTLKSSAAVKHVWSYAATPPSVSVVVCYGAITLPLRMIGMSPQDIEPSRRDFD
jgi:hypothetical protein